MGVTSSVSRCPTFVRNMSWGTGEENEAALCSQESMKRTGKESETKFIVSLELDAKHCTKMADVTLGKVIGHGSSATVFRCRIRGKAAACKQSVVAPLRGKVGINSIDLLKNECSIWSHISHKNVVGFLGAAFDGPCFCLLCEYMQDGSLFNKHERRRTSRASPLTEHVLLDQLQQVASGMRYLHAHEPPIIHRDLKSANVLLDGKRLAIADFGLARYQAIDMTAETGTYRWMAPEIIRHGRYCARCDVYSYAMLTTEMLTDQTPFNELCSREAALKAANGYRPTLPEGTPGWVKDLLVSSWAQDVQTRPTFQDICDFLAETALEVSGQGGGTSYARYTRHRSVILSKP